MCRLNHRIGAAILRPLHVKSDRPSARRRSRIDRFLKPDRARGDFIAGAVGIGKGRSEGGCLIHRWSVIVDCRRSDSFSARSSSDQLPERWCSKAR